MINHEIMGSFNNQAAGTVSFDRSTKKLYSANAEKNAIDYWNYSNIYKPAYLGTINPSNFINEVSSVDANFGAVAVAGYSDKYSPGRVLIYNENGQLQTQVIVGPKPVMLSFDRINSKLLVACEGEPTDDYSNDPRGMVAIIDINSTAAAITQSDVTLIDFTKLDTTSFDPTIRIFGNNGQQSPSRDIEPQHISITSNGAKAFVSLQENNALAIIDLSTNSLDTVVGLGYKDFGQSGLDASDVAAGINIRTYNHLLGMYQPDGLAALDQNGMTYLLSANQGKPRDYSAYSEAVRVNAIPLDAQDFGNTFALQRDSVLGRLFVSNTMGLGNDVLYDSLFTFGGRSFSIWNDAGQLLWDSGDEFEQVLATAYPQNFNSSAIDNNTFKSQSDNQGPQPNCVATGEIDGSTYAFIGLEKMGGMMIYDISDINNPSFVQYELFRDFSSPANDQNKNDLGIGHIEFIDVFGSPENIPMVITSNEVSGTISTYIVGSQVSNPEYKLPEAEFYPNPSTGIFNSPYYGNFEVYDSKGRLVKKVTDRNTIDLSDQPAGYFLIKNEQGQALRVIKK